MYTKVTITALASLLLLACGDDDKAGTCDDTVPDSGVDAGQQQVDAPGILWDVIAARRSAFGYGGGAIAAGDVAAIARATQGVTLPDVPTGRATATGLRAAPSPGALYPIELYVVADNVDGMEPGLYHYDGEEDTLTITEMTGTLADQVGQLALGQDLVKDAALILIITGVEERVTGKYGERGIMYMHMEMGHAAQNALLMATALGLATRPVGAMSNESLSSYLQLPEDHWPAYILAFGTLPG
ncbi:MAG: SagB/ThcOx family dehydrogenase [Deltaproteobacteria bacterium]|nr:SagB/ThcOx family dehydrogenase [Deltaproteobacteria bacterium]